MTKQQQEGYQSPIDLVLPDMYKAAEAWREKHSSDIIAAKIHKRLDTHLEEITLKLLGFDTRHDGKYEIDHCNGRAGNSAAGDYLRARASDAVKEWLDQVELPEIPKTAIRAVQVAYREQFLRTARKLMEEEATRQANELIKQLTAPQQADSYLKTLRLLSTD